MGVLKEPLWDILPAAILLASYASVLKFLLGLVFLLHFLNGFFFKIKDAIPHVIVCISF